MKINTATKFTIARILMIPFLIIILLYPPNGINLTFSFISLQFYLPYFIAFIIFVVAAITDAIDGHIARSTNTITNLGKFLDPIADKLLVNSTIIYLAYNDNIPVLVTIIMIARDIIVDAMRLIAVENNIVIAASIYGKLKTILQMVMISLILLLGLPNEMVNGALMLITILATATSIYSGFDYIYKNISNLQ